MTKGQLDKIIELHQKWLNGEEGGVKANLEEANLRGADLRKVNLQGANLRGANFRKVNLQGAILPSFQIAPPSGDFICWKKGQAGDIIKLKCPWFARRCSSLVGRKIRLELAIVIRIEGKNGKEKQQSTGTNFPGLIYEVGKFVKPDSYDPDIRVECSNGIHAFITRKEAEEW